MYKTRCTLFVSAFLAVAFFAYSSFFLSFFLSLAYDVFALRDNRVVSTSRTQLNTAELGENQSTDHYMQEPTALVNLDNIAEGLYVIFYTACDHFEGRLCGRDGGR